LIVIEFFENGERYKDDVEDIQMSKEMRHSFLSFGEGAVGVACRITNRTLKSATQQAMP
jgi:hypothetical protein